MSILRWTLICGLLVWGSAAAPPAPPSRPRTIARTGRRLTGRFLHITDFHPDPYYETYSSTEANAACHRKHGPAGVYGAETSACDSPYSLVNQTFKWIEHHIKDDIDFVIWTGDSARHDNDEKIPRTQKQVIHQNEFLVSKFAEVFGQNDKNDPRSDFAIPVIPTFGNNDIMPHNIFLSGPNKWTMKYLDIWRSFIPEEQRHQFSQGGWFSVEVIPGKLAVMSLNTIYFFSSNSGVDGCADKKEPGFAQMEWLRIQLQILRERGIKAILMGHVPPARVDSKESWDETCWQKYTLWMQQYRDVIVGTLYGHMNIDHFMLQDFDEITKDAKKGRMANSVRSAPLGLSEVTPLYEDGEVTVASASDYLLDLREAWGQLPVRPSNKIDDKKAKKDYFDEIGGKFAQRYAVSLVAPSVVPNYFPTLRIVEYNITGLDDMVVSSSTASSDVTPGATDVGEVSSDDEFSDDEDYLNDIATILKGKKKHKKKKKKHPKKYKFKVPEGPSKSSPPGPAYSPQTLTWTRYVQYFANLTHINNDFLETQPELLPRDSTTSDNHLLPQTIFGLAFSEDGEIEHKGWKEGKHGKHQGKKPRPEPHPNKFKYEIEYDTKKDKGFKDLTVRRWVEYARKIGRDKTKALSEVENDHDIGDDIANDWVFLDDDLDHTTTVDLKLSNDEEESEQVPQDKKKHRKKHHASKEWYIFAQRAFVSTADPHEIKALFDPSIPEKESEVQMEL